VNAADREEEGTMSTQTPALTMTGEARMLGACRLEEVDCTPVWFMRQAGRCLAEYRELREKYDILTMTRTPDLCTQVTLMPVNLMGVDAAVMYADIMLPLFGMGVPFAIDPGIGPIIHTPIRDQAAVRALRIVDAEEGTPDLFTAIAMVRKELAGRAAVVGFAGAPYTLASYMIEGKPSKDRGMAKALMYGQPALWAELMETLTEVTIRYLTAQVKAGAQVLQLFDSWIGDLGPAAYATHVLPYNTRIFAAIREMGVPSIHFGTGIGGILELVASAGSDLMCVDWRIGLADAWTRIGTDKGIQGNLDPTVVLAPWEAIEREANRVLDEAGGRPGHVFNLGHGVLPDTDPGQLTRLVEHVHTRTATPA
jgi:uroporphyrinogen decarboxylase